MQRKTQQFCWQVQRALNLALADSNVAGIGCELFVDEVSPAPVAAIYWSISLCRMATPSSMR